MFYSNEPNKPLNYALAPSLIIGSIKDINKQKRLDKNSDGAQFFLVGLLLFFTTNQN